MCEPDPCNAFGHVWRDGKCAVCGKVEPSTITVNEAVRRQKAIHKKLMAEIDEGLDSSNEAAVHPSLEEVQRLIVECFARLPEFDLMMIKRDLVQQLADWKKYGNQPSASINTVSKPIQVRVVATMIRPFPSDYSEEELT